MAATRALFLRSGNLATGIVAGCALAFPFHLAGIARVTKNRP